MPKGGGTERSAGAGPLAGRHVLVTAGPTRAPIDAVRFIGNRSTGATGAGVARALLDRGARVHLVYGPGRAAPPPGADVHPVETPRQMLQAARAVIEKHAPEAAVFAAAVLDFVPERVLEGKTPSGRPLTLRLVPTPKLVDELLREAPGMAAVGFKLECGVEERDLVAAARALIRRTGLCAVVANDLARITAGGHPALLVPAEGPVERLAGKDAIARAVAECLERTLRERGSGGNRP